jgi:uncharacterized protein (DUF433 family)
MLVAACCVRRRTGVRWSLPVRLIPWWAERMRKIRMNWKECAVVETVPGKVSGAPVIKGSRVRPEDLIVNRAEGEAWLAENYELPIETVREVLRFYDRHKPAP